jgi:hypothetical protein
MDAEKLTPSPTNRRLIGIIAFAFLITFTVARLFVYLVLGKLLPNFFLTIKGVHIHHFTYGVFILALIGLYFIIKRPELGSTTFKWITLWYGVGLALTFDEFGMWIRLEDDYWVRQSYDAVIIIIVLLLNVAYYKPLIGAVKELVSTFKKFPQKFL